ncbi:MAG: 5-(carboxyamino)imidazole ribonucleotide synthase [Actinobacteria bacterium]|nr:5-(carboxyamino)imidazole ribonucleotide synthase [Actinomycetota bacterium]
MADTPRRPTIGVVGGGQLAWMMAPAAARLGLPLVLLASPDDAAAALVPDVIDGRPDADGLRALAAACDVLTVEHELVDLDTMEALEAEGHPVRPSAATLRVANDKIRQRELLAEHGVPVAPWTVAADLAGIEAFADEHGWPLVLKRPRGGYDGRGVWIADDVDAARAVVDEVAGEDLLVEPKLPIDLELAVLVARRPGGELAIYPAVETVQVEAMCREVVLPAPVTNELASRAEEIGQRVAEAIGSVGMLAIELFVVDGEVLLNELAARPHNAGHVTIEGSVTSQFENHLRAVADLPLGATRRRVAAAVMVNVVGEEDDPRDHLAAGLDVDDVSVHLYGKAARPGRKLGHVTATGPDVAGARQRATLAARRLTGGTPA